MSATPMRSESAQQTATPETHEYRGASQSQPYQGASADLANEIDAFWKETLLAAGMAYASPNVNEVTAPTASACGSINPQRNASYCPGDQTIYLDRQFTRYLRREFGDFAPIAVFA